MRCLGAFAVAATVLFTAPPVSDPLPIANCATPTVKFNPVRVARGGVVTIRGKNFGDCLDTGALPGGAGPLGTPLAGLAIVIDQGQNEFLVATGAADDEYAFKVDIVVPAELEPGEAKLNLLGAGDARLEISPALVISGARSTGSADAPVATFGPPTTEPEPLGSIPPPLLPADIPDEPAATAPPLSAAPVDDGSDNADQRRAVSVGIALVVAVAGCGFALWSRSKRRGW